MNVNIGEDFSTLDAFDIPIDEKITNNVSYLQMSEQMEKITHMPTIEIKIQASKVSSADQVASKSNKLEVLREK
ncbi:hypothetical protein KI387_028730, partial [Taxus chinensis]